ncbi:MAG: MotA/TolQ/ExbB proton channel family protein [Chthonomonadales bacterium]
MLELFHKAGWVAWPLGLFSVIAMGIVLERIFTLSRITRREEAAFTALKTSLGAGGDLPVDPELSDAPVMEIMKTVLTVRNANWETIVQTTDIAVAMQRLRLRRYLSLLATIGSTAPFIGLFGTVLGVMQSFQAMKQSGLSGEAMSGGISEALSATALGLLVAIPSVMAYNFFLNRIQAMLLPIQSHVAQLTPLLQSGKPVGVLADNGKTRVKVEA